MAAMPKSDFSSDYWGYTGDHDHGVHYRCINYVQYGYCCQQVSCCHAIDWYMCLSPYAIKLCMQTGTPYAQNVRF